MSDQQILQLWKRAHEVLQTPYKYGHSDVAETLMLACKNEIPFEEAMQTLSYLEEDYKKG